MQVSNVDGTKCHFLNRDAGESYGDTHEIEKVRVETEINFNVTDH